MKERNCAGREREVEIRTLAHDADESLHVDLLGPHVEIADPCLAICRFHARGENADSGRLPGAVWTKQPNDLTRRLFFTLPSWNKPATRGERRRSAEDLAQVVCANTSRHVANSSPTSHFRNSDRRLSASIRG